MLEHQCMYVPLLLRAYLHNQTFGRGLDKVLSGSVSYRLSQVFLASYCGILYSGSCFYFPFDPRREEVFCQVS